MGLSQRSQEPGGGPAVGRRGFLLLWSAATVSALGTGVTSVALPLVAVLTLHASTFRVGLLSAAGTVAWVLFGLVSGVWADRVPGRPLLVSCDLARALVLLSVPVAAFTGVLTFGQLLVCAFAVGVGTVFFDVASQRYVPAVVGQAGLLSANSRLQGGEEVARLSGPALGGVLVQLASAPAALLTDAASYLVSALCLAGTGGAGRQEEPAKPAGSQLSQIREGIAFLWGRPVLKSFAFTAASFNLCESGILAVQVPFLIRTLHVAPGFVGVLVAADGFGAVLGTMVTGRVAGRLGSGRAVLAAVLAGPLLSVLIPLTQRGGGLLLFAVGAAGLSMFTVVFSILARVYRQTTVPRQLLGRVTAVNRFISWGVLPVGALLAGALGQAISDRGALWAMAGMLVVLTPLPILLSPVRRARDIATAHPT